MNKDLAQLKKLRSRRMEQRFIALQAERQRLAEQESYLQRQQQQLLDFQQWRLNHQESLFADLQNKAFNPQIWLDYRVKLEQLQQEENRLREAVALTQQAIQLALTQVEAARKQSSEANIQLEKVKEIIQVHDAKTPTEEPAQ